MAIPPLKNTSLLQSGLLAGLPFEISVFVRRRHYRGMRKSVEIPEKSECLICIRPHEWGMFGDAGACRALLLVGHMAPLSGYHCAVAVAAGCLSAKTSATRRRPLFQHAH
jgi:hypothetical protein